MSKRGLSPGTVHFGDDDHELQGPGPGRKSVWHMSEELLREIVARIMSGKTLQEVCAMPDMPSEYTIFRWRKASHSFNLAIRKAMRERPRRYDPERSTFDFDVAMEICRRLEAGEFLSAITKSEDMPCYRTIQRWRVINKNFDGMYRRSTRIGELALREARRARKVAPS